MKIRMWVTYFVFCAIISAVLLLIYAAVQQNYRQNADDPQISMAQDIRDRIAEGRSVDDYFDRDTIDLARSLRVFASLYNEKGESVRSTGILDGSAPRMPAGVLDFVRAHGEERVTWQPRASVRMAMVLLRTNPASRGFIAVGRSLKEVEMRESNLLTMVFVCWLGAMALALVTVLVLNWARLLN